MCISTTEATLMQQQVEEAKSALEDLKKEGAPAASAVSINLSLLCLRLISEQGKTLAKIDQRIKQERADCDGIVRAVESKYEGILRGRDRAIIWLGAALLISVGGQSIFASVAKLFVK